MSVELKNGIKDVNIATNFERIKACTDALERDMKIIDEKFEKFDERLEANNECLVRIEKKIDEPIKENKVTLSAIEYRVGIFLIISLSVGWEAVSTNKFLQAVLGKIF